MTDCTHKKHKTVQACRYRPSLLGLEVWALLREGKVW